MVSFKWLVVAGLALGTIGCGSGRVNKLEEQMQTMQMQMDSLSSKMDKLTTMQSNLQKLESLTAMTTSTIKELKVDRITVLPRGGSDLATGLVSAAEQIKAGLGIDVVQAVRGRLGAGPRPAAGEGSTPG